MVRFLIFQQNLGGAFENISISSRKRPLQPIVLLVSLLVSASRTPRVEFRYSERRNRADGPQERWRRGCQPTADLTNLDCRATEIRHERRTAGAFRLAHEADAALG